MENTIQFVIAVRAPHKKELLVRHESSVSLSKL
jgi:hypothetical protein